MRHTFTLNDTVQVFRLGKTKNKKIADKNEKIVQTYTCSKEQFNYIANNLANNKKYDFKTFFSLDAKNCFDCPFSIGTGNGGCYTHKIMQYSSFVSMLKSIVNEFGSYDAIPKYEFVRDVSVLTLMSQDRYVRFGTYGEPSMHPIELVESVSNISKSWTGYTHQYFRKPEYANYLMASTHNEKQAQTAMDRFNYRSFVATKLPIESLVSCPASKEAGFKSNCSACGLCSGQLGKGKKSIAILEH